MGLKSGSRDAGLDDSDDEDEEQPTSTEAEPQDDEPVPSTESEPQVDASEQRPRTGADAPETDEPEPTATTDQTPTEPTDTTRTSMPETTSEPTPETTTEPKIERDTASPTTDSDERPAMSSIPYKMRREKVNEGRDQVPFFLRKEVIEAEGDLQDALEAQLGEDVYKSDYREAAMVVAQRNPELVADVLREWGYDLEF